MLASSKTVSVGKLCREHFIPDVKTLSHEDYVAMTHLFYRNSASSKCNQPRKNKPAPPLTPEQLAVKQQSVLNALAIRQEKRETRNAEMKEKYDLKDDEWFCVACNKKLKKNSLWSHNQSKRHWKFVTNQPISLAGGKTTRTMSVEEKREYLASLRERKKEIELNTEN